MNTQFIVHPKLQHYGLTTTNLDAMVDWYRKVLGMSIQHRAAVPAVARGRAPFSGAAFISNDEVHHRMVFFEVPGVVPDPDRARHPRMQHVAFEVQNFDELLGTYARLKGLGILPVWAADHGMATAFYYQDPDGNIVELNVNVYGSEWTATEHMRTAARVRQGVRRSREDARGPQEGRIALGTARACRRRRVHPLEAVRSPQLLKGLRRRGDPFPRRPCLR